MLPLSRREFLRPMSVSPGLCEWARSLTASFCRNQFQGPHEWVSPRWTQEYSREIWVRIPATQLSREVPRQLCLGFLECTKGGEAESAGGARNKATQSP